MNEATLLKTPDAAAGAADYAEGLSVVSIAKSYDRKVVLKDVSLHVDRGEVVGLLGPNGAGKTTCFYSVMGLVKPDHGRIMLDGQDITGLPMYRRAILGLGYLPQETSIFRGMTVAQNIKAVLELSEPDKARRRERLETLLGEFHITHLRDSPAMALSGGERRRCEIARALAADPSIMLLDEPFAGIDPISISDIRDLVCELKKRDIGVLITDHNVRGALDIDLNDENIHQDSAADRALDGGLALEGIGGGGSEGEGPDFDSFEAGDVSLHEHLVAQAGERLGPADFLIARMIIEQIEET